jgi:hypothetical protein
VEDGECRVGRFGGYEGGYGRRRGDALVEEGDAEERSLEGREEGEGGLGLAIVSRRSRMVVGRGAHIFHLAGDGYQSTSPCVQPLRRRERDGEERVGRAEDFKASVCRDRVSNL